MKSSVVAFTLLACVIAVSASVHAESKCRDAAEDSHYSVIFENNRVRVLALELGRLETTKPHCYKAPHLSILTTTSRTATIVEGEGGLVHDWNAGEARFHYRPAQQTIRNETSQMHREIVVETFLPVQFNPLDGNYDTDEFGSNLTLVKPTWSTSFARGALTATRIQLASGDSISVSGADHVLIALSDLDLSSGAESTTRLDKHDVTVLRAGTVSKLTNGGKAPARFVVVDF